MQDQQEMGQSHVTTVDPRDKPAYHTRIWAAQQLGQEWEATGQTPCYQAG